jgi:hypothetical protein
MTQCPGANVAKMTRRIILTGPGVDFFQQSRAAERIERPAEGASHVPFGREMGGKWMGNRVKTGEKAAKCADHRQS